ncbi:MAG: hypothetical protein MUE73_12820 [Planctomycetes bacterium]|jgi:hypothetical protein|nr:hypothetical protein [Planctomycetota bacterium]
MGQNEMRDAGVRAAPLRKPRIGLWSVLVTALAILGPVSWLLLAEKAFLPLVALYPAGLAGALAGSAVCLVLGLTAAHTQARALACVLPTVLFASAQFPIYALLFRRWRRGGRRQAVAGLITLHLALAVPWLALLALVE